MNNTKATTGLRKTDRSKVAMDRRATFMLAITAMVGLVSQSRRARAESYASEENAAISAAGATTNLKTIGPHGQVVTIRHRGGIFEITTVDGRTTVFPEAKLRFKIDTSDQGPLADRPIILPGGTIGDRASVFFASPAEISKLIEYRS